MKWTSLFLVFSLVACSDSESSPPSDTSASSDGGAVASGDSSTVDDASSFVSPVPITSTSELEQWLRGGEYKSWVCESAPHDPGSGSAHSKNRICSNPTLSADNGTGEVALGAAGVKELYDSDGTIDGYAVYVKLEQGNEGDGWFWYERIGDSVVANGKGVALCVGCHKGAPRDHVFTQVK